MSQGGDLPRCARRGFRCAPRLRRAPQSGDAHSKRATGATCPFGTNGVPIRAVASRPLWIPRRESPCDPALRAGTLSGAAFGGKNRERVLPRGGFRFSTQGTEGLLRAPPGRSRSAACGGGDCQVPTRRRFSICRAAPGGAKTGIAAFQAARITSAFCRAPRVPFRTDEKEPKVRLRTLRRVLRNLREYLAMTRELLPLPAGTPAEGSIQVADAPNNAHRMARRGPAAENNARSGRSRALRACAA